MALGWVVPWRSYWWGDVDMENLHIRTAIAIALGAIPGALGRAYIGELTHALAGEPFFYLGTAFVNGAGCFMIALFYTLREQRLRTLAPEIGLAIATGFCGAFTTFSTYELDTVTLIDRGDTTVALLYWFGSMTLGMVGVQLGVAVGRH